MGLLDGKAVIITGSGGGLGRAYAVHAARAGAAVVVSDVDADAADDAAAELRNLGARAIAVAGSVDDWGVAEQLAMRCVEEFGSLDGLVANAAVKHDAAPWDETEAGLRRIMQVNVLGPQFCAAHAMRAMVESGRGGSIVTVVSGARLGIRGMSAYGASKGAVAAMTANWAVEGAGHGIRVNAVSPLGRTSMALADPRDEAPEFPEPSTVAPVVTALLSPLTAGLTGRIVRFDGTTLGLYSTEVVEVAEERPEWTSDAIAAVVGGWAAR
jgi:NAD(P)-dependent dehydrogenase (short-subunit alcohol dehydrogenase family)